MKSLKSRRLWRRALFKHLLDDRKFISTRFAFDKRRIFILRSIFFLSPLLRKSIDARSFISLEMHPYKESPSYLYVSDQVAATREAGRVSITYYMLFSLRYSFRVTGDDGSRFPRATYHHNHCDDYYHDDSAQYTVRPVICEDIARHTKNRTSSECDTHSSFACNI